MIKTKKGLLVILSSPSGGGKTSVYKGLLSRHEDFLYSISVTTRPKRADEKDGVDYFFVSDDEFDTMIEKKEFVEWAWVHGYRYGTLKKFVDKALVEGRVMLFDVDVQGAESIRKAYPQHSVRIFIIPPTKEELERRLRARGTDPEETILVRLKNADEEVKHAPYYDYIVVNDELARCIDDVEKIISAELMRPFRVLPVGDWEING